MLGRKEVLYYDDGILKRYKGTLYLHGLKLNELIKKFRKIDLSKDNKKKENEIYLSIDTENKIYSFYIEPTEEFKKFLEKHIITEVSGIRIIQQRDNKDKCLILVSEANILGDVWLDYKPTKEIFEFFGIGE